MQTAQVPYTATLADIAREIDNSADGVIRIPDYHKTAVVEALEQSDEWPDQSAKALELAGDILDELREWVGAEVQKAECALVDYVESREYADQYWDCLESEWLEPRTKEQLETLLGDGEDLEPLTRDEYEYLSTQIHAGMLPAELVGDYSYWHDSRALCTIGPVGEETMPLPDTLDAALERYHKLAAARAELEGDNEPAADDLGFTVCLVDGSEYGHSTQYAALVDGPQQIKLMVDIDAVREALADYRKEQAEEMGR